jgi:CubicO group peptidase (beta-lactamase class C family)
MPLSPFETANPEELGFSAERLRGLDAVMQAQIDSRKIVGISLMAARHGKVFKNTRYGYQSLDQPEPMRADAIFRITSMTKPITGAALMILFEHGRWLLDDPIAKFIPEFAALKVATAQGDVALDHAPTMRELLTSTAGFAAGNPLNSSNPDLDQTYTNANLRAGTLADMCAKLAQMPLESQPGTKFRYGVQHDIQARVVEVISGQAFDDFLQQHLFEPLGMLDTGFGVPVSQRDRIAPLYSYDADTKLVLAANQGLIAATVGEKPRFLSGGGGLYTTLNDYTTFALMLAKRGAWAGRRVFAPTTVKFMASNLLPAGVPVRFVRTMEGTGYGANLGIVLDPARSTLNGGVFGQGTAYWGGAHGTWFWIDPAYDITVVGMSQQEMSAVTQMGLPHPAPDLRALSQSLIYQALTDHSSSQRCGT